MLIVALHLLSLFCFTACLTLVTQLYFQVLVVCQMIVYVSEREFFKLDFICCGLESDTYKPTGVNQIHVNLISFTGGVSEIRIERP